VRKGEVAVEKARGAQQVALLSEGGLPRLKEEREKAGKRSC